MTIQRAARLAEVEKLSRKPHQELHASLLDVVLGAFERLTPDEWLTLAKRSPDRLIQSLAMSGKLAGFSDRQEVAISGSLAEIQNLSDSELEARVLANADKELARLAAAVPSVGAIVNALSDAERQVAIHALAGMKPRHQPW
jgi:hypothetical protein